MSSAQALGDGQPQPDAADHQDHRPGPSVAARFLCLSVPYPQRTHAYSLAEGK